jgi:hypothetical protein
LMNENKVVHLDLRGNDIRVEGAVTLGRLLSRSSTLRTLELEWNLIGVCGAIHPIAAALKANRSLLKLDLRNNRIAADGAAALVEMLRFNNTLSSLDLRWNELGAVGGQALVDVLRFNRTLIECLVTGSGLTWEQENAIEEAINRNKLSGPESAHTAPSPAPMSTPDADHSASLQAALETEHKRAKEAEHTVSVLSLQLERAIAMCRNEAQARAEEAAGFVLERQAANERINELRNRNQRLEQRSQLLAHELDTEVIIMDIIFL